MKKKSEEYSKRGKQNRAAGNRFEAKVREDLKSKGWIVDKWMSNIDFEKNEIVTAKRKYNPFMRAMVLGTGFPDFVCFKKVCSNQKVFGIEVKRNGYLDPKEREKCFWYLKNKIFSDILVAKEEKDKEDKRKTKIKYINFQEKYGDK